MSSLPQSFVTPEEYLAAERKAEYKSEYLNGQVFAMAGASKKHTRIAFNLARRLDEQLEDGPCEVLGLDTRVRINPLGLHTYPDVIVACEDQQWEDDHVDTLLNPRVIIEILSPSTESDDRGSKFASYRMLPSLAEYVLVAQDRVQVDHYIRQPNGHWDFSTLTSMDDLVEFPTIGARVKVSDIYRRVALSR